MTTSIQAPQQFKQPSRKGKKAWRKNVDVTAVQQGLENLRDEEIKGYHTTLSFIFLQG
jgi:nucleolar protein 53